MLQAIQRKKPQLPIKAGDGTHIKPSSSSHTSPGRIIVILAIVFLLFLVILSVQPRQYDQQHTPIQAHTNPVPENTDVIINRLVDFMQDKANADTLQPRKDSIQICVVCQQGDELYDMALYLAESSLLNITVLLPFPPNTSIETPQTTHNLRVHHSYPMQILPSPSTSSPSIYEVSYYTYNYFKDRRREPFDVILFPLSSSPGYFTLLAKRQGQEWLDRTSTVVIANTPPLEWLQAVNVMPIKSLHTINQFYAEKRSVEMADMILGNSQSALSWMNQQRWQVPERVIHHPSLMSPSRCTFANSIHNPHTSSRITDLVFMGPIESRWALQMFIDSVDILVGKTKGRSVFNVILVGGYEEDILVDGLRAEDYMRSIASSWPFSIQFKHDAPISYFAEDMGRLAIFLSPHARIHTGDSLRFDVRNASVPESSQSSHAESVLQGLNDDAFTSEGAVLRPSIPSLETCLCLGVPVIVAKRGGVEDMFQDESWQRFLFDPSELGLAEMLNKVVTNGYDHENIMPAKMSIDINTNAKQFLSWVEHVGMNVRAPMRLSDASPTTLILTYMELDGPNLLQQLRSVIQGVTGLMPIGEIIVVSRGATHEGWLMEDDVYEIYKAGALKVVRARDIVISITEARRRAADISEGLFLLFVDEGVLPVPNAMQVLQQIQSSTNADVVTAKRATRNDTLLIVDHHYLGGPPALVSLENNLGNGCFLTRKSVYLQVGGMIDEHESHETVVWKFLAKAVASGVHLESAVDPLFTPGLPLKPVTSKPNKPVEEPVPVPRRHQYVLNPVALWERASPTLLADSSFRHLLTYTHYLHEAAQNNATPVEQTQS